MVGGDHGDTAFQFRASVAVEPSTKKIIDFEVSACEIICRKDTGALLEKTILPRLTASLRTVAESPLNIYSDEKGTISCKFGALPTQHANTAKTIEKADLYITGDLAFQAMALGKESMSGHWCMQCTKQMQCTLTPAQLNDVKLWKMNDLCRVGAEAKSKGQPIMGQKQEQWWPFIPVTHHMVPLLHCEIGIGNQLLDMLRDIINEHIENMTPTEQRIRDSIPTLKSIISNTVANRDLWDRSNNGKLRKALKRTVLAAAAKERQGGNGDETNEDVHTVDVDVHGIKLRALDDYRNMEFVQKLDSPA